MGFVMPVEKAAAGSIAQESQQLARSRKKLQELLKQQEKLCTEAALRKKADDIARSISRNVPGRVALKNKKNMALFDGGENIASESHRITKLAKQIQNSFPKIDK